MKDVVVLDYWPNVCYDTPFESSLNLDYVPILEFVNILFSVM